MGMEVPSPLQYRPSAQGGPQTLTQSCPKHDQGRRTVSLQLIIDENGIDSLVYQNVIDSS